MSDATPANAYLRPESCYVKFIPSKERVFISKPTSNISRFDSSSPIFKKYLDKLTDVMYEAESQKYVTPNLDTLIAFIKCHSIVDQQQLGIKSITPVQEGGIAFDIKYGHSYIHMLLDNDGDASIYLESENNIPCGWDLSFDESYDKLRELLA